MSNQSMGGGVTTGNTDTRYTPQAFTFLSDDFRSRDLVTLRPIATEGDRP